MNRKRWIVIHAMCLVRHLPVETTAWSLRNVGWASCKENFMMQRELRMRRELRMWRHNCRLVFESPSKLVSLFWLLWRSRAYSGYFKKMRNIRKLAHQQWFLWFLQFWTIGALVRGKSMSKIKWMVAGLRSIRPSRTKRTFRQTENIWARERE